MALYTTQNFTTIIYAWINVTVTYNGGIFNPHVQHKYAAAIMQTPIIQNITKIKTK